MFMRVAAVVFLVLIWLTFLQSKSVSQIMRTRDLKKLVIVDRHDDIKETDKTLSDQNKFTR